MNAMTDTEWECYLDAMRKPCVRCNEYFHGASYMGRCHGCHDLMASPYESGEDYIGIGG
jgi:hypothetical protein